MFVVVFAVAALSTAWLVHIAFWRWQLPRAQLKALLLIFALVWGLFSTLLLAGSMSMLADSLHFVGFFYYSLFYWSAALCYVITYSAMEGDSPTLSLTQHLHRMGEKGVSQGEIDDFFCQRPFIGARVRALVCDRILIEESGGYRLRSGKYLFFHTILLYRRIVFGPVKSGG